MHFLADESCDFAVVRALRSAGHDVKAVSETAPGSEDVVIDLALAEERMRTKTSADSCTLTGGQRVVSSSFVFRLRQGGPWLTLSWNS